MILHNGFSTIHHIRRSRTPVLHSPIATIATIHRKHINTIISSIHSHNGSHSAIWRHPGSGAWFWYVDEGYNPVSRSGIELSTRLSVVEQAVWTLKPDCEPT